MGWRTAKAQMAAGTYDVPGDQAGAGFAQGFASAFVPALTAAAQGYAADKREMRLTEHKEALLRQRAAATASRAADTEAAKLLKEQLANMEIAKGIATSLGVDLNEENLSEIYNTVVSNDGDGSQTLDDLQKSISNGTRVFSVTPSAPAPSDAQIDSQVVEPLTEDLSAAEPAPAEDQTAVEMSALTGSGFASPQPEVPEEGVRVASLTNETLIDMALRQDTPVKEQGEEVAVRVADASGVIGGAEAVTATDVVRSGGSTAQVASVLRFTNAVTPINELSSETEIQANLLALEGRTDSFAVQYRSQAAQLLGRITELPDIATMERGQLELYINGGYEKFAGRVPDENLQAHLAQARAFYQSGSSMPPIPASLEEKEALLQSIQSGVFGPVENIPANYLANLNTFIQKDRTEKMVTEQFGDVLSIPNLLAADLDSLDALATVMENSGITNTALNSIKTVREQQRDDAAFSEYADGVTTVAQAENALSQANFNGASPEIIAGLESLRESLDLAEATKAARDNGTEAEGIMALVTVDGVPRIQGVVKYPNGTGPNGRTFVATNVPEGTEYEVIPVPEEAVKAFETVRTENSTIIKAAYESNEALSQGLRNATNVLQIAQSNPDVLTTGGDLAQAATQATRGVGSVLGVVDDLFKAGADSITLQQLEQELQRRDISLSQDMVNGVITQDVQNLASATSLFESQILLLAFRMGALEGQSGAAMSNKDFDRLMTIVDASNGSIDTFTAKLHEYMNEKIVSYDDKAFNVNSQLVDLENTYGYMMAPLVKTYAEIVEGRNEPQLTEAYKLFSQPLSEASVAPVPADPASPAITLETIGTMSLTDIEGLLGDDNAIKSIPDDVFNAILERATTLEAGGQ